MLFHSVGSAPPNFTDGSESNVLLGCDPLIHQAAHAGRGCVSTNTYIVSPPHASNIVYTVPAMSTELRDGPHIPQTVDGTPELYRLLRQRLKDVGIAILKTPPKPYEHNDEAHQSKEALKQWAKNVGADKGVMEILEEIGGDLKAEMYNDLWDLHQVMEDIEIKVGSRRIRSDGSVVSMPF